MKLKATHNLQIQLLMKQGQVEIDPGIGVHNYENCLLIHRNVVESLNKVIKVLFDYSSIIFLNEAFRFISNIRLMENKR